MSQHPTLIAQARAYARAQHGAQRWKNTDRPYTDHLEHVYDLLYNKGGVADETILAAALLHDVLEDTPASKADVLTHFGAEVCQIVVALTDNPDHTEAERRVAQVAHAATMGHAARVIKIADKLANCIDVIKFQLPWSTEKVKDYLAWGLAVVNNCRSAHPALAAAFDDYLHSLDEPYRIA